MKQQASFTTAAVLLVLALGTVGVTSGCATRKYVRTTVGTKATELSARIDADGNRIDEHGNKLEANSSQIQELGSVTRDHTGKIATLDNNVQQVDAKTQQAMNIGQGAQTTADKAVGEVSSLDQKFQNRNNYQALTEEKVLFPFNSAKIEDKYKQVLDGIAEKISANPDAILVMEGRTDATGDDTYNIQLGEKRADAVLHYLVVEKGIPIHRIYKVSFGEEKPVAENKSRSGRAENRAVVMRVMGPNLENAAGQRIVSEASPQR